jgi:hypothetical protein
MLRRALPMIVAALTAASPVSATTITGAGALNCGVWDDSRAVPAKRNQVVQWLLGFLGGVATQSNVDLLVQVPNDDQLLHWMDNYCAANRDNAISEGANALADYLARRAGQR